MAKRIEPALVGVDVSKAELAVACSDWTQVCTIGNTRSAIGRWLKALPSGSRIAVEATGAYHRLMAELAHAQGHTVYLLDGFKLSRYRDSIGGRAKTDETDARLILRYLTHEGEDLRAWTPPPAGYYRIQSLLRRRAALVQARVALNQSLQGVPELKAAAKSLSKRLQQLEQRIEKRLKDGLKEVGWWSQAQRCQAIEGIGDLTSMALANVFHRGHFRSSDAFIAFLGLDVRVRDSGKTTGRRKLTKKGDPELRRLLYTAAMTACRSPRWKGLYQGYLDRGLKRTQTLVILARKLARIAFALMKNETTYQPIIA